MRAKLRATQVEEYRLPQYIPLLPLRAERMGEAAFSGALMAEWDALHSRISPNVPFTSPSWNVLWWKHHRANRLFKRDELCLIAVRDARDALIAVAPMMSTWRPSFGPLRLQILRFFGNDPNVTEIRGLICEPEHELAALKAVRNFLATAYPRADWIELGALRQENGAQAENKLLAGTRSSRHEIDGYHLELPTSWETLRASRSRNIKESIRRCYNSLKRAGLTPQLRVIESPGETPAALETFFHLHSLRSRLTSTVRHGDVFQEENERAFLREYALDQAQRGRLRIFQLLISGSVVATRVGFLSNGQIYLYYSGYEPAWSKYSVMTTLVVEVIKWSIEQRLAILHMSTGTDVSKLRWSPTLTRYHAYTEVPPNWKASLSFSTYARAQRLLRWWQRSGAPSIAAESKEAT